ncbi:MAG: reverse transcriptase-like protein [Deltaproteobacteria bacterium]|nr:reverse transcriptase-like protein [Deltaproteobacteria bacterium]
MPWVRAKVRGTSVYARVDDEGRLAASGGRVEIRYQPRDGRLYRAVAANVSIVDATILPEETCGPAEEVQRDGAGAKGGASVRSASAAGRSASPAGRSASPAGRSASPAGRSASPAGRSASPAGRSASTASASPTNLPTAPPPDEALAYSDGACSGNPGPAGLGVVVIARGERIEVSEYLGQATNNVAELTAVLRAVEAIEPTMPLVIYTDSRYAIGVVQQGWKAKANTELVAELRRRIVGRRVELRYVPGHAGVELNERADALARLAISRRASDRRSVTLPSREPARGPREP